MSIENQLDQLASIRTQAEQYSEETQSLIDSTIPDYVWEMIAIVKSDRAAKLASLEAEAKVLEIKIRAAVIDHGETVSGATLQAVWNKGRHSWDTKALEGYAVAHPEIMKFVTVGQPTVSIRARKGA